MKLRYPSEGQGLPAYKSREIPWERTTWKNPPAREFRPNGLVRVQLTCGATDVLPWPVVSSGIVDSVWCPKHGDWHEISTKPRKRETKEQPVTPEF